MNTHGYTNCQTVPVVRATGNDSVVRALIIFLVLLLSTTGVSHADGLFDFQMKLANKGNVEAQFRVGEMYENGFGVEKNEEEGLKWITKAAEQGHETAGFKLLYFDIRKNGVNDGNRAAFDELNTKALASNGQAQYFVGLMYANGVGVKKDEDKALEWLSKASLVGVTAAEAEITKLRQYQQRAQLEQRRAAEQRKAREEVKRKEQERKQIEARRKAAAAEEERKQAEIRASEEKARAKAADQKSLKEQERARRLAQHKAEEREKEQRRQALLEQRKDKEQEKQEQFESDPCSGKSARFLSTCR